MYKLFHIIVFSFLIISFIACSNSSKPSSNSTSNELLESNKKRKKIDLNLDLGYNYYFHEGMAVVCKNEKWGFIDKNGNVIIPFEYDEAEAFSEGLAMVKKDEKVGFVNNKGELVIPLIYDHATYFKDGISIVGKDYRDGAIDKTGKIIIPIIYYKLESFSDGLAYAVMEPDERGGFIDKKGSIVIPFEYDPRDDAYFYNGLAVVHTIDEDFNYSSSLIIDKRGNVKYQCSNAYYIGDEYDEHSEGLFIIHSNGNYGFIDQDGDIRVPIEYLSIGGLKNFSEGYAAVIKDWKWGFVDRNGNVEVALFFDYVDSYHNGLARVEKSKKYGYIDKNGDFIIPLIYDSLGGFSSEGLAVASINNKWGYIDKQGNVVIPFIYDYASIFREGLAFVEKEGIISIIDTTGKEQ